MKFSDGFWLNRHGFDVHFTEQAYEITTSENSVTVFATSGKIYNRAMTLGGVTFEITYTSAFENVFKVTIRHFRGTLKNAPEFELNETPVADFKPVINNTEKYVEMISGDTRLVINKDCKTGWKVEYFYKEKKLTGGAWRSTSYIEENQFIANNRLERLCDDNFWSYPVDPRTTYMREQLDLSVGECIYGFGEKFTTFVKNGQNVEIWNSDGGTCSYQSYKSIPFYISSRGYGVLVNSSDKVSYEVASDSVSKVSMTITGEELEYFLIGGANPAQVLERYTTLTGKPALPPAKTFGLWLSTSFTTTYNEETVTSFIDGMAERDIPLQMFHFDCFWMKEYEWCGFEWDKSQFPDPANLIGKLRKDKNLGICVWINPYVSQRTKLFDEGVEKGYFIKNLDGSVFQTDMWQPGMAIVDFTNLQACRWYASKITELCEMGVTAIKTDFGERIPTKVKYSDGSDPIKMHNYYTYLYNKVVFTALEKFYGKNKACLFARSATVGGQKFPVHWGGDCSAKYSSMAETLRGGLSLCASGFGYFSHDIGGFEETASPDVYKRWCAFGLMSTHSRLHGSTSYRVPWAFEEDTPDNPENACAVLRFYTKLKGKLMPYLYSQAVKTSSGGVPMMRAMFIDYPEDPACLYLDRQYMFGDNLLVAPVFNEEGIAEFYVPAGKWTDIVSGEVYEGGKYFTRKCGYMEMPILAKPCSIIGFGSFCNDFEYDYVEGTDFVIYELGDGETAFTSVYDTEAEKVLEISATRNNDEITVKVSDTDKKFTVSISGTGIKQTIESETTVISL